MATDYKSLNETNEENERARRIGTVVQPPLATITEDGSKNRPRKVSDGDEQRDGRQRKLSIPFSVERRKTSYGIYSRVVLCAVDMSNSSRDAFNWYLANIWKSDDLIVLCYCPEPPNMPSFSFKSGITLPTEKWKEILDEANQKTRKLEEDYELTCIEKKLRYKMRGESYKNAGEGICRVADEECANMIVMGSRGVSGIKRAFIGSVSEYVVRNTTIPCLIVPSPK